MCWQAQEKIRHSLKLFKMKTLFLAFQIHCKPCKGNAYHFTGAFRRRQAEEFFPVKKIVLSGYWAMHSNKMNIIVNRGSGLARDYLDWLELVYWPPQAHLIWTIRGGPFILCKRNIGWILTGSKTKCKIRSEYWTDWVLIQVLRSPLPAPAEPPL